MQKSLYAASLLALVFSVNVSAGPAKTLVVEEKIELNAPADKVWALVGNFGDLAAWHPALSKSETSSGTNNKPGAVRDLTLKGGGKIAEKLHAYSAKNMSYKYGIIEGPVPFSHYVSIISVKSAGAGKSIVIWKGTFKRQDTGDTPAAGQDDETAVKAVTGAYKGTLENLKKIVE